jgi:hypothetical protein
LVFGAFVRVRPPIRVTRVSRTWRGARSISRSARPCPSSSPRRSWECHQEHARSEVFRHRRHWAADTRSSYRDLRPYPSRPLRLRLRSVTRRKGSS